ncbi:Bifunctional protein HldE [uncultured archaeon]|nr:Bifunctional protein HldE [uncultured archaeon]
MAKKILLLGDYIEDVNLYGTVTRLCPEAPVPVWVPGTQDIRPGGMGLVRDNLDALGFEVFQYILSRSRKTRFWSGKHLVMRKDEDTLERKAMDRSILPRLKEYDAVVVSDYNKGGISNENAQIIANQCFTLGVKLFVDTKRPNPWLYKNAYAIFPNRVEYTAMKDFPYQHVVLKDGKNGSYVDGMHCPAEPAVEEFDVTGAGDVFLAAFVEADLDGWCLEDCARFGNLAAAISVKHRGGYVLTPSDIKQYQGEDE